MPDTANSTDSAAPAPLLIVGDPTAAACVGDFCEIPPNHDQAVVNRRIDAGLV